MLESEKEINGHDLEELYGSLSPSIKKQIKNIFENKTNRKIEEFLKENKNVFVDFRYFYESFMKKQKKQKRKKIELGNLFILLESLHECVNEYCK